MVKKTLAILSIILLIGMYIATLIAALLDNPATMSFLGASIGATVMIPVVLWIGMLFFKGRKENKKNLEEMKKNNE